MAMQIRPIIIRVPRDLSETLDVVQEVAWVKDEAKLCYLLECIQKTPPPVLILTEVRLSAVSSLAILG